MEKSLPATQEEFIREQVASGRYESREDVITAALELLRDQERLHALKVAERDAEIQRGLDEAASGSVRSATEVFDRLAAKYGAMAAKKRM